MPLGDYSITKGDRIITNNTYFTGVSRISPDASGIIRIAMGRTPRSPGSERKEIWFTARQIEMLNALRETSALGKPSFTALVLKAVDVFVERQLAKSEVREDVAKYLSERPKVVALRDVKR